MWKCCGVGVGCVGCVGVGVGGVDDVDAGAGAGVNVDADARNAGDRYYAPVLWCCGIGEFLLCVASCLLVA